MSNSEAINIDDVDADNEEEDKNENLFCEGVEMGEDGCEKEQESDEVEIAEATLKAKIAEPKLVGMDDWEKPNFEDLTLKEETAPLPNAVNMIVDGDVPMPENMPIKVELTQADFGLEQHEIDAMKEKMRAAYAKVQQSWYHFGKEIAEIQNNNTFIAMGYKDFKELCTVEFFELDYTTIIKTITVLNNFGGAIEAYIESNPNKPLPARESLYTIQTAKDRAEKSGDNSAIKEIDGMLVKVMDGDLSYLNLRAELKGLKPFGNDEAKELESEVTEVINKEGVIEEKTRLEDEKEEEKINESKLVDWDESKEVKIIESSDDNKLLEISEVLGLLSEQILDNCKLFLEEYENNPKLFNTSVSESLTVLDNSNIKIDEFFEYLANNAKIVN